MITLYRHYALVSRRTDGDVDSALGLYSPINFNKFLMLFFAKVLIIDNRHGAQDKFRA